MSQREGYGDAIQGEMYKHNAGFIGIYVSQPAWVTTRILPNLECVYVPLGDQLNLATGVIDTYFAFCPNHYHDKFYHWQFIEHARTAKFISPLLYLTSAN